MKKIQILMSTYNGEAFIRKQIESILTQKGVEVHLLIRDDGSSDNTLNILKEYKEVKIIQGKNIGTCKSFFQLINKSENYDYYSFADQDDVWDDDKLISAINILENYSDRPGVYASNTRLVDADLSLLKIEDDNPRTTFGSAFIKNYCTGCTMVFNDKLMCFLRNNLPDYAPMHDWWINLVCLSIGGISCYDKNPHINYRQHGKNVFGAEICFIDKVRHRWKKFLSKPYHRDIMARELLNRYEKNMTIESKKIVEILCASKINFKEIVRTKEFRTQDKITNLLFIVLLIFNKI